MTSTRSLLISFSVLIFVLMGASTVSAATTIGTSITTAGTITVSGNSTSTLPRVSGTGASLDWLCLTGDTCRTTWPSAGASFGKAWEIVSGFLSPTTTIGIQVNATSSMSGLNIPLSKLYNLRNSATAVATSTLQVDYNGNVRGVRYTVRPEDFGAVGDGVTDDSAAFAAAIASLPATGGEILLMNKIYKANIVINKSWVHLRGQGKFPSDELFYHVGPAGTTILANSVATPVILVRSTASLSGVQITDLAVRGTSITDGSIGVEFSRADGGGAADSAVLDRVSIISLQICLNNLGTDSMLFTNGTIYECGQIATFKSGLYNSIQSSILFDSPQGGVNVTGGKGFSYIGNIGVGRTGNYDLRFSNTTGAVVSSNIFEVNADDTALPTQVQRKSSIVVASSTMVSITGNQWSTSIDQGIGGMGNFASSTIKLEASSSFSSITGNVFDDSPVNVWGESVQYSMISGNVFGTGSTLQIKIDAGTGNVIGPNRAETAKVSIVSGTLAASYMGPVQTLTALQSSGGANVTPLVLQNAGAGANTAAALKFNLGGSDYGSIRNTAVPTGGGGASSLGLFAAGTAAATLTVMSDTRVGIGTTTPVGALHVSAGQNATTTVTYGELGTLGQTNSRVCFNAKNTVSADISFYFVGTTMVVESNKCR